MFVFIWPYRVVKPSHRLGCSTVLKVYVIGTAGTSCPKVVLDGHLRHVFVLRVRQQLVVRPDQNFQPQRRRCRRRQASRLRPRFRLPLDGEHLELCLVSSPIK